MQSVNSIRFLLGDQPRTLSDPPPTMTVLDFLRKTENMTGTKEGCAEGDCGACTVVVGRVQNGRMHYRAVNSCIMFVPFLNGQQLITVEHLKTADGQLHAVQRAMVEEHGSQCGFCTPGFIMSMFAMYHNRCPTDRQSIDNALAGNLCRCTGYAPIVRACRKALKSVTDDQFDQCERETVGRISKLDAGAPVEVRANGQKYFAPTTTDELAQILKLHPESRMVAGATDVGLWVTKQRQHLETVVYTGAVESLTRIDIDDGYIRIGAAVTIADAMAVLAERYNSLDELFVRYGSEQIRNLATLGGNVANGSPIGDSLPALVALDARLLISSKQESRTVAAENFFIDYGRQDLAPGEYLERIDVPLPREHQTFRIFKISKRFHQDISAVCGAFSVTMRDKQVQTARVCYGGMAATPLRAANCEQALVGNVLDAAGVAQAREALDLDFSPITDFRGSSRYRTTVATALLERFADELRSGEPISVWQVQHA
ncbi:MAG: xanthine dehydrogenase small subunit [Acidiferrobacterales bacterium]|nr:xanthine dehydrogenase small subunit [Acidiferrobacterales bacterium]